MGGKPWTDDEIARLVNLYPNSTEATRAAAFPDRTDVACRLRARKEGVAVDRRRSLQGDLGRLLEDDPIAAYWVGFIFADGSLVGPRLQVDVARKDRQHLERLAGWLGPGFRVRDEVNSVSFACQDRTTVARLRERFDLRGRKTYNPPRRLPYDDDTLLRSWLCGVIDGDGLIRTQTGRRSALCHVVMHLSWLPLLSAAEERLAVGWVGTRPGGVAGTGTYAHWSCHRHNDLVRLRAFAEQHALPVMARKWSRVDMTLHVRGDMTRGIRLLLQEGLRGKAIVERLGCSYSHVANTKRRMGL